MLIEVRHPLDRVPSHPTARLSVMAILGAGCGMTGAVNAQLEYQEGPLLPTVAPTTGFAPIEITRDGRLDLATLERNGRIFVYRNLGHDEFEFLRHGEYTGLTTRLMRGANVDGRGTDDLAWVDDNDIYLYFTSAPTAHGRYFLRIDGDLSPTDLELADLDQDGDLDVLTANNGAVQVRRNRTGYSFDPAATYSGSLPLMEDLEVGDIDGDGDIDAVFLETEVAYDYYYYGHKVHDSQLIVLFNNGDGSFTDRLEIELPYGDGRDMKSYPQRIALGDLDGDSDLDIAVSAKPDYYVGEVRILRNDGQGTSFTQLDPIEMPDGLSTTLQPIHAHDSDMDGDIDLVVSGCSYDELAVILNLGGMRFDAQLVPAKNVGSTADFQVFDYNNDGMFDIANQYSKNVQLVYSVTPPPPIDLDVEPLIAGRSSRLSAAGGRADDEAIFAYRFGRPAISVAQPALYGLTVEVGNDFRIAGTAAFAGDGRATLAVDVPTGAPQRFLTFQAVAPRSADEDAPVKSNFVMQRITH